MPEQKAGNKHSNTMKVRYIKDHPDPAVGPGFVFAKGTVAEHDDADAQRRIDEGLCVMEDHNARARKLDPSEAIQTECIPIVQPSGNSGELQQPGEMPPLRLPRPGK